ncbi:protein of unknown function [Taphrina deformans PYCC 5710]|uniref:Uncharacterized protein n=1 Tax=Taphrina deformans (strain PYCC 5710 / ATCC 11124 / CBS 356.35 / IMI 108563 / JCM 9778 / NBRC 8474) TaxID=1097556 RepID=R4XBK9_TAPDE|nr:protein of unknown function [Taphrina deformans PYCC 5710]|eukprot:CCG80723.1 protein of unknown function [Taphrina deformans PYCC 5710]
MSVIVIAIVALVVVAVLGFAGFLAFMHIQQRRRGGSGASSLFPSSFKGMFGGSAERETGTRFAALDVDEAWDTHVDEEMGYDSVRMHDNSRKSLTHEELDDRYDEVMDGGEPSNPFGSGSTSTKKHTSAFREGM